MSIRNFLLILFAFAVLAASHGAEARGRKFSCPLPDKRSCMSTEEVYASTSSGADLEPMHQMSPREAQPMYVDEVKMQPKPVEAVGGVPVAAPNRCCSPVRTEVTVKGDTLAVASPVAPAAGSVNTSYQSTTLQVVAPNATADASMYPVAYPSNYPAPVQTVRRNEMVVRTTRDEPFRVPAKVMRIFIAPWEDEQGDLHMGGYVFSEVEPRKWSVGATAVNVNDEYRLLNLNPPVRDAAQDAKTGQSDATAQANRSE